ncbi:MAG: hypothetical protein RL092_1183 [Bacteroidota bacterium]|jgi:hypothetical protein
MIIIENTLVSEDLFEEHFVCDLAACKGACCVEGDSGAPVDEEEIAQVQEAFEAAKPWMTEEGIAAVDFYGGVVQDSDGDWVTTLVSEKGACAFVHYTSDGTALCAIEMANKAGHTNFRKPISCHLYPIRLTKLADYIGLNYHKWPICAPACTCGSKLQVPAYVFLKEAIIRKFGEPYYVQLHEAYRLWKSEK